jgi:hypothetical protein
MTGKDGNELIDEIAKEPNLDRFFDCNPKTLNDDDLRQLIEVERQRRALFIEKKGK